MKVELNLQELEEAISSAFSTKGVHIKDGSIKYIHSDDTAYSNGELIAVSAEVQSTFN